MIRAVQRAAAAMANSSAPSSFSASDTP
jgi:hypothetical protein